MLQQQLLEIMLCFVNDFLLMIIVDLLTIMFGQRLKAFTAHKQNAYLG